MQKKLFILALALCILLAALGICASATEESDAPVFYVDATGSDDNTGETAETPFATLEKAMTAAAAAATEGTTVTVYVNGSVALPSTSYQTPEYNGTVKIVGVENADSPATITAATNKHYIYLYGALEFEDIAFSGNGIYLVAQNKTVVMGEGLDMTDLTRFDVYGGVNDSTGSISQYTLASNITIRSGTYDIVTGGSYSKKGASTIVDGGSTSITLGASGTDTLTINRFAPFGVYANALPDGGSVSATVTLDGSVTLTNYYMTVLYGNGSANGTYDVDVFIKGAAEVDTFADLTYAYTANYNVYYDDTGVDGTKDVADSFAAVKNTTEGAALVIKTATYQDYCGSTTGHTIENHVCTNCGYEHTFDWTVEEETGTIKFTCSDCDSELSTVTPDAAEIYVSENGIAASKDVTGTIGTTAETAFADFDLAMNYAALAAAEGVTVKVNVVGAVEVPDNDGDDTTVSYTMPEYAGTISIVGVTVTDETTGTSTKASLAFAKALYFYSNGSLEISNVTVNNTDTAYFVAQSNPLVLGTGLEMAVDKKVYVIGDCYKKDGSNMSTDVTIRSGNYNLVTGGTFQNQNPLKGGIKLTMGTAPETDDTLVIDRFAPIAVYYGKLGEDVTADVYVDGAVTVNAWAVDRILGSSYTDSDYTYEYFVNLYLNGDIADKDGMFQRATNSGIVDTTVTYNIYSNSFDDTVNTDVAMFTALEKEVVNESDSAKVSVVTVYTHKSAAPAGYTFADKDGVPTFTCACDCGLVLATHTAYAETVYVSADGITEASDVTDEIGKTPETAFADFDMAMQYAAAAAAEGVTVTVNVIGAVAVPDNDGVDTTVSYTTPEYAGTVKIVGAEGASLTFGGSAAAFYMNGALEFSNIKFDNGSESTSLHLAAQNNKLVLGEGITTNAKMYVIGGFYNITEVPTAPLSSDITVLSGSYEFVTGGSFEATTAKLTMVEGSKADITLGAATINRFSPFGVYGNYVAPNVTADIEIVGNLSITGGWRMAVAYGGSYDAENKYTVNLYVKSEYSCQKYVNDPGVKYNAVYNVYYINDATKAPAEAIKTDTAGLVTAGERELEVNVYSYSSVCEHTNTVTNENGCDVCTVCGHAPTHGTDCTYDWALSADKTAIVFTCSGCGSELGTVTPSAKTVYLSGSGVTLVKEVTDIIGTIGTTADTAFADFDLAMNYAALVATEGETVTVNVNGTVDVPVKINNYQGESDEKASSAGTDTETEGGTVVKLVDRPAYNMPSYAGTISIVGVTDEETSTKASLAFEDYHYFFSNGSLEISNIKFSNTGKVYISANSKKLVLDTGLEMKTANKVYVIGDAHNSNNTALSTDVTIRSGNYNLVTGGTFRNNKPLNGEINLTIGAKDAGDTLTISRFAPFTVYGGGTPKANVTADITVDGAVTVATWRADRLYGAPVTTACGYFVNLYLTEGCSITNGDTQYDMFKRDPQATPSDESNPASSAVIYNIYYDSTDSAATESAKLFTDASLFTANDANVVTVYKDDENDDTVSATSTRTLSDGTTHIITVNKHLLSNHTEETTIDPGYTMEIENGAAVFYGKCECHVPLAVVTKPATEIYVSATGVTNAADVTAKIGTTAEIAFPDFDMAMKYAALAATEGVTVKVNVIGAVAVPYEELAAASGDVYLTYTMPSYDGKISIVGVTEVGVTEDDVTEDGVTEDDVTDETTGTSTKASLTFGEKCQAVYLNGALAVSNIELANTDKLYFIAQSNPLELGTGITNTVTDKYLVYVVGDTYYSGGGNMLSDVTIRSGRYNFVVGGTFNNTQQLKGDIKLTMGTDPETDDTLVIDRFAPIAIYGGTPAEDISADITVDGAVTVNNWFADKYQGKDVTNGKKYLVNLCLKGDITDGSGESADMFQRNPGGAGNGFVASNVIYNIYYDSTNTATTNSADLFTASGIFTTGDTNTVTENGYSKTSALKGTADDTTTVEYSYVTINTHMSAEFAGYTMTVADGKATFTCACGCGLVLAEHESLATEIYVSANGVTLAKDVTDEIGKTAATAFPNFEMAMEYAKAAATEGVTVTVNVVGAVEVPDNDGVDTTVSYTTPEYAGTVKIVGAEDGASLTFGGADTEFYMNGALEFENIAFENSSKKIYIVAQNKKLVLGEGLDTTDATMYAIGGFYDPNGDTPTYTLASDITVRSGTYSVVTGGSYSESGAASTIENGGSTRITLGALGTDTLKISRFAPFGVYANALTEGGSVSATVMLDGAVTFDGTSTNNGYFMTVAYGAGSAYGEYNVDVIIKGASNVEQFKDYTSAYTANYNVYYDTRVNGTETVAGKFAEIEKKAANNDVDLTVTTDTYYTYCDEKLDGHFVTTDNEYTCDSCTECGYTYHAAAKDAVWTYDEASGKYTFTCSCGGSSLTADTPYVYVGSYNAGTFDENGERLTDAEYGGAADGMGELGTPVKTIAEAVRRMAATGGKVILAGDYDIYDDIALAEYTNKITFTSVLDEENAPSYGFICEKLGASFNLNGPTSFENIKFDMAGMVDGVSDDGSTWTMPMTLVFAAHWNDLTFGEGISALGQAYVVAGSNRLSYDEEHANIAADGAYVGKYVDSDEAEPKLTFNAVDQRADGDENTLVFFERVYLGDRLNNVTASYVLENKEVTAAFNDAVCGTIYSCTTSSLTYAASGTASGEDGEETTDGTTEDVYDIVTLNGCKTTLIFNGNSSAEKLSTGYQNTYDGYTTLDALTVYLNGNSAIGSNSASQNAFLLFNVEDLKIYISDFDDDEDWAGEGERTNAIVPRVTASISDKYLAYRENTLPEMKAYIKYSAHSVEVYPRFSYDYSTVDRDYTDDHSFERVGDEYVCTVCKKSQAAAAMSPVIITPVVQSYKDGVVTVKYVYSYPADYKTSTGLEYSIVEAINNLTFTVAAPDGFTLESIKLNSFASAAADYTWYGSVESGKVSVTYGGSHKEISNNRTIATATFSITDKSQITADTCFTVSEITATRLGSDSNTNLNHEIIPVAIDGLAAVTCDPLFSIGVILKSEYILEYLVPVDEENASNCWMVFEKSGDASVAVSPYEVDDIWHFAVPGIAAKEMNDGISASYNFIYNDMLYSAAADYNIVTYYNVIKDYYTDTIYAETKDVLNAMLNYGAAAQKFFNYNEDNLVNEHLDEADRVDYTDATVITAFEIPTNEAQIAEENLAYTCVSQFATLEQRILVTLMFETAGDIDTSLTFKGSYTNINDKELPIKISNEEGSDNKVYTMTVGDKVYLCVDVDTVAAKDLRQEFTGALYNANGEKVSDTVTTSFEAYAATVLDDANAEEIEAGLEEGQTLDELRAVCRAALAYCDAAAAYLEESTDAE